MDQIFKNRKTTISGRQHKDQIQITKKLFFHHETCGIMMDLSWQPTDPSTTFLNDLIPYKKHKARPVLNDVDNNKTLSPPDMKEWVLSADNARTTKFLKRFVINIPYQVPNRIMGYPFPEVYFDRLSDSVS